ncbi:ribbon-helix-helix protein, CopG family [Geobacillus sp. BMUD]|nr:MULTISPECIES: ribbon-helix-helix protein, CopG family [Geobacillus]NNU83147.1 ribbon-helix-helix protein, CopG family [Geobacillus sp. BMUD]
MKEEKERVEIRMPKMIVEKLEQYQKKNGIPTRTAAILELLRKGTFG